METGSGNLVAPGLKLHGDKFYRNDSLIGEIEMKKKQKASIYVPTSFGSFLIQSVGFGDYSSLRKLALKHPLLNLPADPSLLKKKIQISEDSFKGVLEREKRQFLFVIKKNPGSLRGEEGEPNGEVIGSSQISSKFGTKKEPFYSLKIFYQEDVLQLKVVQDGPSYLGGILSALCLRFRQTNKYQTKTK